MTEPGIDPERLAALLEGRLDEKQREEVLARLASSDEDFEAYVDALAVTRELEAEDEAAGVTPLRPKPRGRWLALAAVLSGLALAPWLWTRANAPGADDPGRFVAMLAAEDAGLPEEWNGRPWSVTRGPGDPRTEEAGAVRLGARLVDLELAVRTRDPRTEPLALEVVALLEGFPAGPAVAGVYREVAGRAGGPPGELEPLLEEGRAAAGKVAGEEHVEVGAWAEAARIAAARRDAEFFRARGSREALERAAALPSLTEPARGTLERVRAAIHADGGPEWSALERELGGLLRVLGA